MAEEEKIEGGELLEGEAEGAGIEEAAGEAAAPDTEAEAPADDSGEVTQEAPVEEEVAPEEEPGEVPAFVEEYKPKSDLYTLMLILSFLAFLTVIVLAGREAHGHYDVQFWLFKKHAPGDPVK